MAKKTVTKKKKKKNKAGRIIIRLLSLILSIALIALSVFLAFNLIKISLLPKKYLLPAVIIVFALALLISLLTIFKARRGFGQILCFILVLVLSVAYGVGNVYLMKTSTMFDNITDLTDKVTNTVSLRVMSTSSYEKDTDLNNLKVGYAPSTDEQGTAQCLQELEDEKVSYDLQEYSDVQQMANDLYDGTIQGMILNESYLGILSEDVLFTTVTKELHKTIYYTERDKSQQLEPDQVDVSSEPFTVLISGNDNYGTLSGQNRSDVNMLVTVNPNTGIVLMTSIPRDLYVETNCASEDACLLGQKDKLTHTGLYGVGTTEQTLEKLFGITINYNVTVNFSSLVNMVDALDGIDVYVEDGLAVKQFYSNSTLEGVTEGWNHLDGERALAFARERHAYSTGDNQRVINQQIVLSAIIDKVCSPSILLNYGKLVDAVGGAFETNMPASDMQKLMKFELANMPDWTFESYSVQGEGDYQYCAALGSTAYVQMPYDETVVAASQKIQAVCDGKSSSTVEDPMAGSTEQAYSVDTSEEIQEEIDSYNNTYDYSDYSDYSDYYYSDDTYYDTEEDTY